MLEVQICQDFGWTYEEYLSQPVHFLAMIREKMRIDGKRQEREAKQHHRG